MVLAIVVGVIGLTVFPTYTTPAVPLYGLLLCLLFVVPVGILNSMSGINIPLNVIAEFVGGLIANGNPLEMNFFKSYGYEAPIQVSLPETS